jgi:hypothetical protein
MLPSREVANINVPSVIRVPDWVEEPLGRYYLYYASHYDSRHIGLAVADHIEGPWRIHAGGVLRSSEVPAIRNLMAAPDVHVDEPRKQIRMYFHSALQEQKHIRAFVSTSTNGLSFEVGADLAETFYFRAFAIEGVWYALSMGGVFGGPVMGCRSLWPGRMCFLVFLAIHVGIPCLGASVICQ